ncbi:hypothetical protein P43SY_005887 [Pythium insidiosum]|uniref:VPS9 domain-containing protein n=1 Tax=Pythium insidiosum TaxID=114742 RepID=A0AAD5M4X2_PYTIN|nr:hypothetical protein P43SY_005887 [Pythium insidiosum]
MTTCATVGSSAGATSGKAADRSREQLDAQLLAQENEQLRREVADLTGALKARDMEIAALQSRVQFLVSALEQQDATIAKIYAATEPSNALDSTPPLGSAGRDDVVHVAPVSPSGDTTSSLLHAAIDRLLKPTTPRKPAKLDATRRLFEDEPSGLTSPTSSCASKSSSTRSFGRRESCASEEDVSKSAGFLRRPPSRRVLGRLSVSDFGLLDDASDKESDSLDDPSENQAENEEKPDPENDNATCEGNGLAGSPPTSGPSLRRSASCPSTSSAARTRSRPRSQRNLFAEIDEIAERKARAVARRPRSTEDNQRDGEQDEGDADGATAMTYAEFLERLRLPASRDILDTIRLFLASILGPRGDGEPPRAGDYVEYDFYGTHEFRRRCEYFFHSMSELLQRHPVWRHASEATLATARDGIEKYVMDKLCDIAMNQLDECVAWREEDDRLLRRMQLLSFITPDMLDIKPCMRNEVVWSMAEDELRRINACRAPGDKINCIVRCCSIIFGVLNLSRGDSSNRPGADDFLPVFIYIVLHSKIPRLHSNCEYIAAYRDSADLMSNAIEFINVVDASMLSISDEDFQRLYIEEERKLGASSI